MKPQELFHHRRIFRLTLRSAAILASLMLGLLAPAPIHAATVTEAWVQRYGSITESADDRATGVVVDTKGDTIVTGTSNDNWNGTDIVTIKYSGTDGSILWQQRYNGSANRDDRPAALAVDSQGNVVVTGVTYSSGSPEYYTAKYAAADGALLWEKRYGGDESLEVAVTVDQSGNVFMSGRSDASVYTAKHAATDGAVLWEQRYNKSGCGRRVVAVDSSGNVVVTGTASSGGFHICYTLKYGATDGVLLWEKLYDAGFSMSVPRISMAVDSGGNVVVAGRDSSRASYTTSKYAAADGALLWEKLYSGTVSAVAVDGSGNVVVAGNYTVKYAATNGTVLWTRSSDDGLAERVLMRNGTVWLTGTYWNGKNSDFYTVKLNAADGALLWEKIYDGPESGDDFVRAAALTPAGDVVVTGTSDGDFLTILYRELPPSVELSIHRLSPDSTALGLSWPAVAGNFVAEESNRVEDVASWRPVALAPTLAGDRWLLRIEASSEAARFYRLRSP